MIGTPESLIQSPFPDAAVGPAGNDALSDALRLFRVTGTTLMRGEFTAPWAIEAPPASILAPMLSPGHERAMVLHIVVEGSLWVEADGIPRRTLSTGSIVGFPRGNAHRMGCGDDGDCISVASALPPPPWKDLPVVRSGAGGEVTRLVCLCVFCDDLLFNPILSSLPPLLVVSPEEGTPPWISVVIPYLVAEASASGPGSACFVARLTELVFIEVLRRYIASMGEGGAGWLAALGDRHLARAFAALHGNPEQNWTISKLACETGLSRSALMQRFNNVLGTAPMRYVALWRLQLAAHALQTSDKGIAQIAEEVGYGSEEALSRAFKRETGASPAVWRRERHEESRMQ